MTNSTHEEPLLGTFSTLSIGIGGMIVVSILIELIYRSMVRMRNQELGVETSSPDDE